jgi:hypothetical protein
MDGSSPNVPGKLKQFGEAPFPNLLFCLHQWNHEVFHPFPFTGVHNESNSPADSYDVLRRRSSQFTGASAAVNGVIASDATAKLKTGEGLRRFEHSPECGLDGGTSEQTSTVRMISEIGGIQSWAERERDPEDQDVLLHALSQLQRYMSEAQWRAYSALRQNISIQFQNRKVNYALGAPKQRHAL